MKWNLDIAILSDVDELEPELIQSVKNLVKQGHRIEVITIRRAFHLPVIQDLEDGYRLVRAPVGPLDFCEYLLRYIKMRKNKFDVIHSNAGILALVGSDLGKIFDTGVL